MASNHDSALAQNANPLSRNFTSQVRRYWIIGLVMAACFLVFLYLYQFSASTNRRMLCCRSACHQVLDPISFADGLPSLLPIDESPHAAASFDLLSQRKRRSSIEDQRRNVTYALAKTSDDFVTLLERTTALSSCSAGGLPWLSVHDDLRFLQSGLSSTVSKIEAISRFYALIREEAIALLQTKLEALEAARLGPVANFWLAFRPLTFDLIGWNPEESYVYPLEILSRETDALSSFVVALDQGIERAEGIGGLLSRTRQKVTGLSASVVEWEAEADGRVHWLPALIEWIDWWSWLPQHSRAKGSGLIRLEMLQRWYHEQIVQDSQLGKKWKELDESISHGEDRIPLRINNDWCEQSAH